LTAPSYCIADAVGILAVWDRARETQTGRDRLRGVWRSQIRIESALCCVD
jgi:hypothetical protein